MSYPQTVFSALRRSAGLLTSLALVSPASAALIISVGDHTLQPNQSGQQVALYLHNDGDPLGWGGLDFSLRLGEGSPGAPSITGIDLLTDTPFADHNFGGQFADSANTPQKQFWSVISVSAEIPTGFSRLATVTFDTTGFDAGQWDLQLFGSGMPSTSLFDSFASPYLVTLQNGQLTVVPEGDSLAVAVGISLIGFAWWRRALQAKNPTD